LFRGELRLNPRRIGFALESVRAAKALMAPAPNVPGKPQTVLIRRRARTRALLSSFARCDCIAGYILVQNASNRMTGIGTPISHNNNPRPIVFLPE
jgi:hypothetical protein